MTSYRQIEANRRNALRSTGPKTEERLIILGILKCANDSFRR